MLPFYLVDIFFTTLCWRRSNDLTQICHQHLKYDAFHMLPIYLVSNIRHQQVSRRFLVTSDKLAWYSSVSPASFVQRAVYMVKSVFRQFFTIKLYWFALLTFSNFRIGKESSISIWSKYEIMNPSDQSSLDKHVHSSAILNVHVREPGCPFLPSWRRLSWSLSINPNNKLKWTKDRLLNKVKWKHG